MTTNNKTSVDELDINNFPKSIVSPMAAFEIAVRDYYQGTMTDRQYKKLREARIEFAKAINSSNNNLIDSLLASLPKPERDYSKDNADEESLRILTACAATYNELLSEVRTILMNRKDKS